MRMKDKCGSYILGQVVDEVVKERGLACTDLTGQYDEAFFLPDTVIERSQCLLVRRRQVKKTWIGRDVKRMFSETIEVGIHGVPMPSGGLWLRARATQDIHVVAQRACCPIPEGLLLGSQYNPCLSALPPDILNKATLF